MQIRPKIECVTLDCNFNLTYSEVREIRKTLSESSALELKLDINELQELHTTCTRPANKNYITQLIAQLVIQNKNPYCPNSNRKAVRKWSDIVADRSCQPPKPNSTVIHNIETVITSRTSRSSKETYEMDLSNITQSLTVGKKKTNYHHDGRPRIVALGDSHARRIADELMHQSNHRFNTIGYVKPNAKLSDLLNTAKK